MSVITQELLIGVRGNDLNCFEKLFSIYRVKLFNFSYKHLRCREDAEEVVQDTFVRIWENRATLNEELSFNSYLFTIAKNLIINKVRKKVAEPRIFDTVAEHSAQDESTENEIIYRDINTIAERAIQNLPAQRRLVYNLSRKDGLTYEEIGSQLGISSRTVEAHLRKALKSIREFLYLNAGLAPAILVLLTLG
ncbi:MAG TPA: RNA polymerase sigma-70 factor [Chryseosolibacter sp.]